MPNVPKTGRSNEKGMPDTTTPGMKAALDALKARKGKPDEAHAPRPKPFPGPPPPKIPGQMSLDD